MNLRQKLQFIVLIFLIFLTFASYHHGTGSTAWLQYLTVVAISAFVIFFDLAFTNDSMFIFDPDAENWRRKTVRKFFVLGFETCQDATDKIGMSFLSVDLSLLYSL
jgi:hypothetical protein